MNNIYPSKELLSQSFKFVDNLCTFCENCTESTDHIFFSCQAIQKFWCDIHTGRWICPNMVSIPNSITTDKHVLADILVYIVVYVLYCLMCM